jgi:hypothetical protein
MKRLAAALFLAFATAVAAAPAVSSASGTVKHPAKKAPMQYQFHGHDGPCPFAAANADV